MWYEQLITDIFMAYSINIKYTARVRTQVASEVVSYGQVHVHGHFTGHYEHAPQSAASKDIKATSTSYSVSRAQPTLLSEKIFVNFEVGSWA